MCSSPPAALSLTSGPVRARLPAQGVADLHSLEDVIHLSLQDEVLVDLLEDDRLQDTNVHQRIERRWLAELRVPFSTLYINGRVGQGCGRV